MVEDSSRVYVSMYSTSVSPTNERRSLRLNVREEKPNDDDSEVLNRLFEKQ